MIDLVVLCDNCHGLFHGHKEVEPPRIRIETERKVKIPRSFILAHEPELHKIPEGEIITLTAELVNACRANGSFTNSTLNAFGLTKGSIVNGWPAKLVGKQLSRDQYAKALEGRFTYREKLNR